MSKWQDGWLDGQSANGPKRPAVGPIVCIYIYMYVLASLYTPLCFRLQDMELTCAHTFGSSDINHIGGCRHLRLRLRRALPEKGLKTHPYRTVEGSRVIKDPYIICIYIYIHILIYAILIAILIPILFFSSFFD